MTICNSVDNILFNLEKMKELGSYDSFLVEDTIKEIKYIHKKVIRMEKRLRRYVKAIENLGFIRIRK